MNILPEIFDKHAKYKPWLWEKYGDTFDDEKNRKKREENERLSICRIFESDCIENYTLFNLLRILFNVFTVDL